MLRHLVEGVADRLPGQCAVCRAWPAQPVCEGCVARFAQPQPRCGRCALPLPSGTAECGRCLREPPPLDACLAAVNYDYPWSGLITQFKFNGEPGWARTFALLMRSAPWVEPALDRAALVLPMPLSAPRLAERGFNQALLLARALAPAKARADLLLRTRHTRAQTALDRRDRAANVKGAFAVEPALAAQLRGARLVLVDDVMTSGASIFSAAAALRRAGAAHITAVVIARTELPA
ncbi:phosphoribosyltransferase family protein [Ramlibacter sp.]|uniref:phosphoribosyltransferase family protein n=1 Tax=Ramlibacter sp. TaxID=1917967 RepID=UPI002B584E72|nr:phosphoribosyltransferase family protein [Ramlibacter sp.]HWI81443.1 phosphoribosyltransferase family protein [Ramlibacter sp.]